MEASVGAGAAGVLPKQSHPFKQAAMADTESKLLVQIEMGQY